jgi:AraC family transcriptional activator of pobA
MAVKKKHIPLHRMDDFSDLGFHMERTDKSNKADEHAILLGAHRDDHYVFVFQDAGSSRMMLDFTVFQSQKNTLFFILPGQVHRYLGATKGSTGWFIAVNPALIPGMFRMVLEDPMLVQEPIRLSATEARNLVQCLQLLLTTFKQQPGPSYSRHVSYALLSSFSGIVAGMHKDRQISSGEKLSRTRMITGQFRKLLANQYKTMKSPAEYAAALNLSLSYLNEAVKSCTGSSVSYWIQHEIVLEAERLLYHTESSVKEIAYELGYEDHTYFSRLFKKVADQTPGAFRRRYRE